MSLFVTGWSVGAYAQTDGIQFYDAEIVAPGHFEATLHNNWDGTLETAYGMADWWELGLYLPIYIFSQGIAQFDGGKVRTLSVVPDAAHQTFFYGVNFEFSFNNKH